MRINIRIDCSPNEFRRLGGQPDLLPLAELAGVAMERWLQQGVAMAGQADPPAPPSTGQPRTGDDRGEAGGRGMQARGTHGGHRSGRG